MTVSTDAKLAWGVDLGEEVPEWLFADFGVSPVDDDGTVLSEALQEIGLTLEYHCSDRQTMYVLCVERSVITAWRGHPRAIRSLDVPAVWRKQWKRVARAGKPKWLLFSWWC